MALPKLKVDLKADVLMLIPDAVYLATMSNGVHIMEASITPEIALKLLRSRPKLGKAKRRNRPESDNFKKSFVQAMKRGDWDLLNTGLALDDQLRMIDGSHRCESGIRAGVPFPCLVFVGQSKDTTDKMDSGKPRNIKDKLALGRPDEQYVVQKTAIVSLCSEAIAGNYVRLDSLGELDRGTSLVAEGLEWGIETFSAKGTKGLGSLRQAVVAGAFVFAHKKNPKIIAEIGADLVKAKCRFEGFTMPSPESPQAFLLDKLEEYFSEENPGSKGGGNGRAAVWRAILNVLMAAAQGKTGKNFYGKVWKRGFQDGDTSGEEFFKEVYTGKVVNALRKAWAPLPALEKIVSLSEE